jgi:hypothetical protein
MASRCAKSASILLLCLQLTLPARPALGGDSTGGLPPDSHAAGALPTVAPEREREGAAVRLRPVLAASAFLLGSAAAVLEVESDRAYARYLDTADPRRMSSYYDTSERKRNLSTAALVGAEVSAVALVVTYLLQKRPAEPEPGSVIISLAAAPGGLAVRVRW